jgi:hypothetical protein
VFIPFCFLEVSMVLRRHVLWSLLAALLLCTLAAANSLPIPATSVPTSTSIRAVDSASRLSVGGGHSAGVIFTLANRAPEERSGQLAGLLAGKVAPGRDLTAPLSTLPVSGASMHNNVRFRTSNWDRMAERGGASTPEPGSLLLLSSGLIGIAGMLRRRLTRG